MYVVILWIDADPREAGCNERFDDEECFVSVRVCDVERRAGILCVRVIVQAADFDRMFGRPVRRRYLEGDAGSLPRRVEAFERRLRNPVKVDLRIAFSCEVHTTSGELPVA